METWDSAGNPLVILNPAANRGHMTLFRNVVRRHLKHEHAEYRETTKQGEAEELAKRAARQGRSIIIVGGDGSVNEVANGILTSGRRVPLGIVAAGSGNDYAWNTLKLPRDPAIALERAFKGRPINVDAGVANERYFANCLSVGLDADATITVKQLKKIPFMCGAGLYMSTALKQLLFDYHRCPWLTLCLDDGQQVDEQQPQRYVLVAVTIGPTYGAGFRINPTADPTDGLFDICTISYISRLRVLRRLPALLPVVTREKLASLPQATFNRAKAVQIESKEVVNIQMDGELIRATACDVRILPGALWVRV